MSLNLNYLYHLEIRKVKLFYIIFPNHFQIIFWVKCSPQTSGKFYALFASTILNISFHFFSTFLILKEYPQISIIYTTLKFTK